MTSSYQPLVDRFLGEVESLGNLRKRILRAWELATTRGMDQDIILDSVALNLHGFYSGIEGLFVQVAQKVDEDLPQGEHWHRELLARMQEETEFRPALVAKEDVEVLDELLRFRHLVRNVYAFNLLPERIAPLVAGMDERWQSLRSELDAFARFLRKLAEADDEDKGE